MENWTVTPEEKKRFEIQFISLNPANGNITGDKAKGFFMQSRLPPNILAFIWELSDVTRDGQLNLFEFIVACKLIQMKLRGHNIPPVLPAPLSDMVLRRDSVVSPVISPTMGAPIASVSPPSIPPAASVMTAPTIPSPLIPTAPAVPPLPLVHLKKDMPLVLPTPPASVPSIAPIVPASVAPVVSPDTSTSAPITIPSASPALSAEAPPVSGSPGGNYEWSVPYNTKLKYTQMFNQADKGRSGFLTGNQARSIMILTQLPVDTLAKIWQLSDIDGDGQLSCEEFVLAMHLCDMVKCGKELQTPLPADLLPPTFMKKTRQNSLTSAGSNEGVVAAVTTPEAAFEDKRKENFEKGQAELERRRQALIEIQRQEKEERERKEKEEEERREKIRLEQERRRQEELEKQLHKQREIEREKDIERQKAIEQREEARKEMERQRHFEWEKQRIVDLEVRLKKELEIITAMREKSSSLNTNYQSLCEKVRELTKQTGETRNGVNAVKSTIDSMRSSRDSLLNEITTLKAQLKEQNHKLITLNKEKANFEGKTKYAALSGKTEEQMKQDISNEQSALDQLREDVKQIKEELERKKLDFDSSVNEIKDLKESMTEILKNCEDIYSEFHLKKEQVFELKAKKLREINSWSDSAWDTTPDTWSTKPETQFSDPETKKVRALYEFVARKSDELSFQPGDIITISATQNSEPGWFAGEFQGKTGWFPESYVENMDESVASLSNTRETVAPSNGIDPSLEDIAEVPENVSDTGSAVEDIIAPVVEEDTPSLDDGTIANLAVQGLYQWIAKNDNQLSLGKGNIIRVSRKCNNWYYGENQGYSGWFPKSYVKEITAPDYVETSADFDEYYEALYPYAANESDDLSFDAGEVIKVIKKDGDWWTGELNGRCGMFPSNYVQKTECPTTFSPTSENDKIPRCASAPPTRFENQTIVTSRSITPDFSSLSETESGKRKPEIATVIAPYQATSKEQLSLHKGQLIMIRKKTTSGWWEGESHVKGKKRQVGWFPASYVKVVGGGGVTSPVSSDLTRKQSFPDKSAIPPKSERVVALYKYSALNADELSFEKGDIIKMITKEEPDWWKGELNGVVGLFPSNYVQPLFSDT